MSELNYIQTKEIVENLHIFGAKPGLERIKFLLGLLGNPQKDLKVVHVAGTNGKGTTASYISSVLNSAGYKTGLFTSPYVIDFRERFKICGEMISKEDFTRIACQIMDVVPDLSGVRFFEFVTALAFVWFKEQKTDFAVLETGIGGRFDATNSIDDSVISIIASISLDHTAILGDTVDKIAGEKAGIIKQNGTLVLYPLQENSAVDVIKSVCDSKSASFNFGYNDFEIVNEDITGYDVNFGDRGIYIPFLGHHQILNAGTALKTIDLLIEKGYKIDEKAIKTGFKNTFIPARMEVISKNPLVILDGGHNEGGAFVLKNLMNSKLKNRKITAIIGMMADKDSEKYLNQVAPLFDEIITTKPSSPRSLDADSLKEKAKVHCQNVTATSNVNSAVEFIKNKNFDTLIICGSLYLASEIREKLKSIYN